MQIKERVTSLDPRDGSHSRAKDEIGSLLFEGLTYGDENGTVKPALASGWQHDPQNKLWQFHLRDGVRFHDSSTLSAKMVAAQLASGNPNWKIQTGIGNLVYIDTDSPTPNLPAILALPRFAITAKAADGSATGTGAFRLQEWDPGRRALLAANEDYWGGRPYVDSVEVVMAYSLRDQLLERRLDRDDAVQVEFDQIRNLLQANQSIASSGAADTLLLAFPAPEANSVRAGKKRPTDNARLREAISLAIDRASIANVLLQRQGQSASALLPQWFSGYEFLFSATAPASADLDHARTIRAETESVPTLTLGYETSYYVSRLVAERIVVNAREAGINMQLAPLKGLNLDTLSKNSALDMILCEVQLSSSDGNAALYDIAIQLHTEQTQLSSITSATTPDELYAAEKHLLENLRYVPIVHVPEAWWLNQRMRHWKTPQNGGWRIEDVWLEGANGRP